MSSAIISSQWNIQYMLYLSHRLSKYGAWWRLVLRLNCQKLSECRETVGLCARNRPTMKRRHALVFCLGGYPVSGPSHCNSVLSWMVWKIIFIHRFFRHGNCYAGKRECRVNHCAGPISAHSSENHNADLNMPRSGENGSTRKLHAGVTPVTGVRPSPCDQHHHTYCRTKGLPNMHILYWLTDTCQLCQILQRTCMTIEAYYELQRLLWRSNNWCSTCQFGCHSIDTLNSTFNGDKSM
jgi:hypothetical protein